jgi:hypothetical protein
VESRAGSRVLTTAPDGSGLLWLDELGRVTALEYSHSASGGAEAMSCTLQAPPSFRTNALNPGRIVQIYRGTSRVWNGRLDEAVPVVSGWSIQARGVITD